MFTLGRRQRRWRVPAKGRCREMCFGVVLAFALWKLLFCCAPVVMYWSICTKAARGADLCRAPWLLRILNNSCSLFFFWAKVKCSSIKHVGFSAVEQGCNSSSCNSCRLVYLYEQHLDACDTPEERKRVIKYRLGLKCPKEPLWSDLLCQCRRLSWISLN